MSKCKGTVTGCGKGKFSYFVTLDSKEGFYFNTKFEPKCGKGDVVGIEYDQKASNRGNVKKIVVLEKNSNGYEDTSNSGGGGGNSGGGGGGGGTRHESIVWQHSQEMAIRAVHALEQAEAVKLPAKADARRVVLEALIDELTVKYFKDALDPIASKTYKEVAGIEEDAEQPKKEEPPEEKDDDEDGWDDWD